MTNASATWTRLATLALGGAVLLSGCGAVLPTGGGGAPVAPPAAAPPVTPVTPAPQALPAGRLARRLALDLALGLPSPADVALLVADPTKTPLLINAYLQGGAAGRALAGLHPRMWHLDSRKLPDLDRFVAAGDQALAAALTPAARQLIVAEPTLFIRHVVDHHLPFSAVYTSGYALVHASLVPLWNLTDAGEAFAGEPYRFAAYKDGRPAAGVLAGFGLSAAFANRSDPLQQARAGRVLQELLCLDQNNPKAHLYTGLSSAELAADLGAEAVAKPACAGCHLAPAGAGTAFAGVGSGDAFAAWVTYAKPASALTGSYAGVAFTGMDGFAADVGNDPRTHRCELTKLLGALYQRPASAADTGPLSRALDQFYAAGLDLSAAVKPLLLSPEYAFDVVGKDVKGAPGRQTSGVRLLGLAQWQGIAAALAPSAAAGSLALTDDLDAGHDETVTADDAMPSGAYWHRVDQLARQLAAAIVAAELADGVPATARRLLTDLPDGAGNAAAADVVNRQLKDAWQLLTTESLKDTDPIYTSLTALWAGANADGSPGDARRAWRVVLVGMLTHPHFLTY